MYLREAAHRDGRPELLTGLFGVMKVLELGSGDDFATL